MKFNLPSTPKLLICSLAVLYQLGLPISASASVGNGVLTTAAHADAVSVNRQAISIQGVVTSATDGRPFPGVSIKVKENGRTTTTSMNGTFRIEVPDEQAILVFTFVGYKEEEVRVGSQRMLRVALEERTEGLDEVVVTALGIKRSTRSLGYSVGELSSKDINKVAQDNVLNSITGKVPGVSISSTGSTGSSVSMVIRGAKSLSSDNQPLFVVDGVPIANTINNVSQVGTDNNVDYGNALASLNPDDIESISILKGPSAAALYGSRAGNGVVLITTKSGSGLDKVQINVTSNTVFDVPYKYLDMHHRFAAGVIPFTPESTPNGTLTIEEGSAGALGPELDRGYQAIQWNSPLDAEGNPVAMPLVSHPNNIKEFVQTGITSINGVSIANNTEKITYRISYSNMMNRGLIPNSDLSRNSLNLNSSLKLTDKLKLSSQIDFSRNGSDNRPAGNRGTNPLQWAYAVAPHINILDLKDYWLPGQEGVVQRSQSLGDYDNPYFLAYEVNNAFKRDRVFGNIRADWQITPEISLMGRYALDLYHEKRETKVPYSYSNDPKGAYGITNLNNLEQNIDFLASYQKRFNDVSFNTSIGGNTRYQRNENVINASINGSGLTIPNLYTLSNIAPTSLRYNSYIGEKAIHSIYGLINVGYKDFIYLDLTARNDWSSTLPKNNRSYFYPSASLSVLLNDAFKLPDQIDLLKLRGGWARAGNDTSPYNLINVLQNMDPWGNVVRLGSSSALLIPDLKPEQSTSYEGGLDFALFNNRLRFAGTYYKVDNRNQIIPIQLPSSSGYTSKNINAGLLVSKGWELSLGGTPIKSTNWNWDINLNWSRNRTRIMELSDGLEYYELWSDAKGGARTYIGDEIGDLYDAELVTVKDVNSPYYGYPILDENGSWQSISMTNTRTKIGNFNPDFSIGLQSGLSYKRFSLNFSLEWRKGGKFVSQTYRYYESDMKTQRFLDQLINPNGMSGQALRDYLVNNDLVVVRGNQFRIVGGPTPESGGLPFTMEGQTYNFGAFNPGVIAQYDDDGNIVGYTENLGGEGTKIIPLSDNYPWDFMSAATFDADFIKLREISLGYELPGNFVKKLGMQSANVSIYSRNIILWTKSKIGIDPETAFQPGAGTQAGTQFKQGIERYNVNPWVMPIGFKIAVVF